MKPFAKRNKTKNAPAHTLRQNITFGIILVAIALFVAGWWIRAICNGYYSAFVEFNEENAASALEEADNRQRTEEDAQLLAPLQTEFDSWRTRHLAEHVYAVGANGDTLHGLFYDCGYTQTVVVLPGYGQDSGSDFLYAPFYAEQGYNILLTDPRCHGESGGSYLSYGLLEKEDAAAWCEYVTALGYGDRILVQGYGMGAAAALMAAGDGLLSENVTAIVAESVYDSLDTLAHYEIKAWFGLPSFPFLNLIQWKMSRNVPYELENVTVSDWVGSIQVPVIFLAGEEDQYLPSDDSLRVQQACTGQTEWLLVEGADWGMCYARAAEQIQETLSKYC